MDGARQAMGFRQNRTGYGYQWVFVYDWGKMGICLGVGICLYVGIKWESCRIWEFTMILSRTGSVHGILYTSGILGKMATNGYKRYWSLGVRKMDGKATVSFLSTYTPIVHQWTRRTAKKGGLYDSTPEGTRMDGVTIWIFRLAKFPNTLEMDEYLLVKVSQTIYWDR